MVVPLGLFKIPRLSSVIDIVNNILEIKTVKATVKVVTDITKPYVVWFLTTFNFFIMYIIKTFNTVPVKLTKDLYYIEYFYEGKEYRIIFPIKNYNNINIVKTSTNFSDDKDLVKYLGPNNDLHGIIICPKDLNYKNISITYFKDDNLKTITKTFTPDEDIILN